MLGHPAALPIRTASLERAAVAAMLGDGGNSVLALRLGAVVLGLVWPRDER